LTAADLVRDVPRVNPKTPLDEVMRRFSQLELVQLPVVTLHDPDYLVGSVARGRRRRALDREVLRRRMLLTKYLGAKVPRSSTRAAAATWRSTSTRSGPVDRTDARAGRPLPRERVVPLAVKPGGEGRARRSRRSRRPHLPGTGDRVVSLGSRTALSLVSV
jgi:hypothetical protein